MHIDSLIHVVVVVFFAWGAVLSLQCALRSGGVGLPSREPKHA